VADVPTKNSWGLVRMDRTAKMQQELSKKKESHNTVMQNPRLWRSDWRK
jgi:hypothetical protein